jgi:hypothetical protein
MLQRLLLALTIVVATTLLVARAEGQAQQPASDLDARLTALSQRVTTLEREICALRGGVYAGGEASPCYTPGR